MSDYEVFAERERAGWRDEATVYAYVARFGPVTEYAAKIITEREGGPGRDILDLCCGQGDLTAMLAASGAQVTGLDFSPVMLDLAAKRLDGVALQQGDAADLPFADESFDLVVCNFGMMHLPDQPKALDEIRRVLRPKGRFVMATWAAPDRSPAFGAVFGAMKAHADLSVAPPQPDLFQFAREEEARTIMAQAGLELTAHETVTPTWELAEPEELFEIFLTATVGSAVLIRSQTQEVLDAIAAQVTRTVARNFQKDGGGYSVPVPVVLLTAARG